ncbi:MAG: Rpn family recombination-promoting nuclease/putative transposase [Treponema sp.]|nr:Rpn family recombination-promoting nuclease/putative transposase [Treponema sp.]
MSKKKKSPSWEELTFANNFLFCKIMESEPELCRRILEILLGIKIARLEAPQAEKTVYETLDSKSVRFDVYAKDRRHVFDIEIQTTVNKKLPKRARYYQSVIDMDILSSGDKYSKLKDSYVIFLCLDSPFKERKPVYFFENMCREDTSIKLNDGAYKVFFNASEYDKMKKGELKEFLRYLKEHDAGSELTKSIEEKVSFAKKNMMWRKQYMTWQQTIDDEKEDAYEEGLAEGISQGIQQKAKEDAVMLVRKFNVNPQDAANEMGVPLDSVLEELNRVTV